MASPYPSYEGRLFTGPEDPDYKAYEIILKNRQKERLRKLFGVEIPSEAYSGFDLLELESFLRLRRPEESLDHLLKLFPRAP
ncbi:MAG: hypothetical protein N3G78_00535 [Desulfobacterota bacterium]|nr:hypothetical protein [Thermodesulfobacteriota bacterium]